MLLFIFFKNYSALYKYTKLHIFFMEGRNLFKTSGLIVK